MDIGTLLDPGLFLWHRRFLVRPPARPALQRVWRVAAYPFAAIVIAEAFFPYGPAVGGMYIWPAIVGALIGVIVDWIVTGYRSPALIEMPETEGVATAH